METIKNIAEEYEKKLNEIYARANTKSKRKRIVYDLFQFSNVSFEHFDIEKDYEWENDAKLIALAKDYRLPFAMNITKYDKQYSKIFNTVLDTFIDSGYCSYDYYYKDYMKISEMELEDIICGFLDSYDSELLKKFETKIENKELFYATLYNNKALTYTMPCINKNLMFYTTKDTDICTIDTASVIVHEFGHSCEMDNMYKTGRRLFYELTFGTPYYEISSRFLQYAFIRYLVENRLYSSDTDMLMHNYLLELQNRSYDIVLLSMMNEVRPDSMDNVFLRDEDVISSAKSIQERLNYYSLASNKDDIIKYRKAYIYGIGSLMSIYLYDSYKKDPNYFKKEFRNSLINYPYVNSLSAFENVGINLEVLTKGDALKRILKK